MNLVIFNAGVSSYETAMTHNVCATALAGRFGFGVWAGRCGYGAGCCDGAGA